MSSQIQVTNTKYNFGNTYSYSSSSGGGGVIWYGMVWHGIALFSDALASLALMVVCH